jgi:UDP-N-acetylglucosamine 2-epimerase
MVSKLKILTVVGARPQFIKAAMVSRAIAQHQPSAGGPIFAEEILHTGQHYDPLMSQVFFEEMEIPRPAANLQVGSGNHGETTGAMLAGIEREILARKPDRLLVYGDTNSTLAGALAAAKLHVPVVHVEAGLRSYNRLMPEEINRVLVDHVSSLLCCPSEQARTNLAREGIERGVHVVGDVMYDAVRYYRGKALVPPVPPPFILCTLHRAENTDDAARLRGIVAALQDAPLPVVLPLHPRTRKLADAQGIAFGGRIGVLEPVSYFAMLGYIEHSAFVVTDSGGVQKEAFFLGKRCITVRDETEWTELVACGANRVVGTDPAAICQAFSWAVEPLGECPEVYGRGDAGERIAGLLERGGLPPLFNTARPGATTFPAS